MPIFEFASGALVPVATTTFAAESLRERDDIQRSLRHHLGVLDPDLLFVAEEYALFENAQRRVDLLALDRTGKLVVIELKRTEDGGHMELQALRYAAMVSTMTTDHLIQVFADNHSLTTEEARTQLEAYVDTDALELSDEVRIILVSAGFSQEVTATVLWLTQRYGLDISCYRLLPYKLDSRVLLDVQRIIPLPEASDYQVRQRQKGAEAAATRAAGGRDYTKYDLKVQDRSFIRMSKQGSVHTLTRWLASMGVSPGAIRNALDPQRWVDVHPEAEESVEDAFRREFPERRDHYWFDLEMRENDSWWVMPRLGGTRTEQYLAALTALAPPGHLVRWSRAAGEDEELSQRSTRSTSTLHWN
jgi:hypothetical protein